MTEGKDKIKDLFSSKLGSFESEVPTSVWGGLDQILSQSAPTPDPTSSSTSTSSVSTSASNVSLIKTIALIAGLAAVVVTAVLFFTLEDNISLEKNKVVALEVEEPKPSLETNDADPIIHGPNINNYKSVAPSTRTARVESLITEEKSMAQGRDYVSEIPEEKETVSKQEKEETISKTDSALVEDYYIAPIFKRSSQHFIFGVVAKGALLSDNTSEHGSAGLFSNYGRTEAFKDILDIENSESFIKHKQPISFGLTLGIPVTSRLSIETGLIYTHLSSKLTSNSIYDIEESQKFAYLGVPLLVNYTFYEIGKTKLYASAGGMIQKDIHGKYISRIDFSIRDIQNQEDAQYVFYSEPYYLEKTIKQSRPQFSVRTALGISYPLYKKLYLYGTVGGVYYFNAGNEYRTIYSDKKIQLDLDLGIKFDF